MSRPRLREKAPVVSNSCFKKHSPRSWENLTHNEREGGRNGGGGRLGESKEREKEGERDKVTVRCRKRGEGYIEENNYSHPILSPSLPPSSFSPYVLHVFVVRGYCNDVAIVCYSIHIRPPRQPRIKPRVAPIVREN